MGTAQTNDDQIVYWNEKAGPKWVGMQERLDAQLERFNAALLDRAGLKPGEHVLDLGCGCGATTLAAAQRVSPGGSATGADISRPMLARARERATAADIGNTSFIEADAQTHAFEPTRFDAAISRFGVMFFIDPVAAFTNIRRAVKPGGRLSFICWRPMKENPWVVLPLMAAAKHIELPAPPDPFVPGPFAFADGERTRGILAKAGFADAVTDKFDLRYPIGNTADFEQAVDFTLEIGPVSALLLDKPESLRKAVRQSIREALAPHHTPEGVVVASAAWLVSARNA